jgi:hypothetical protein
VLQSFGKLRTGSGPRSVVIPALVADGVAHHSDPDQYATCLPAERVGV